MRNANSASNAKFDVDRCSPRAANCFADYGAAQAMSAEHTSELRGGDDAVPPASTRSLATPKVQLPGTLPGFACVDICCARVKRFTN